MLLLFVLKSNRETYLFRRLRFRFKHVRLRPILNGKATGISIQLDTTMVTVLHIDSHSTLWDNVP